MDSAQKVRITDEIEVQPIPTLAIDFEQIALVVDKRRARTRLAASATVIIVVGLTGALLAVGSFESVWPASSIAPFLTLAGIWISTGGIYAAFRSVQGLAAN